MRFCTRSSNIITSMARTECSIQIGTLGQKLEADFHIIHGVRTRIQNTIRCVKELPLDVEDVVFTPFASAQVVLTQHHIDHMQRKVQFAVLEDKPKRAEKRHRRSGDNRRMHSTF